MELQRAWNSFCLGLVGGFGFFFNLQTLVHRNVSFWDRVAVLLREEKCSFSLSNKLHRGAK